MVNLGRALFFSLFLIPLALVADAAIDRPDGPHPLTPERHKIGQLIADVSFVDLEGRSGRLSDYRGKILVVALNKVNCPLSRKWARTMNRFIQEYMPYGVQFLVVNANKHATLKELRTGVNELGISARYAVDFENKLARALGALTTTEVFILDRARTLRFRGPWDDQFGLTYSLPAPRRHFVREAMAQVLTGKPVPHPAWSSPGCALGLKPNPETAEQVTFHNRISRIMQKHCQSCHRPGEGGPFPLIEYRDMLSHSAMIELMVSQDLMPPWFADPKYGVWKNDPTLAPEDKKALLDWLAGGMPEGDTLDAPEPVQWTPGWQMGEPDVVISIPQPIKIPESGVMDYQYVLVKNPFPHDVWIEATEIRPSAPSVVHHVLVMAHTPGDPARDGGLDGFFAAMVPGNAHAIYPKGVGRLFPKGKDFLFQLHYTPNGMATEDQTKLGIRFAKETPKHDLQSAGAWDVKFVIPAGHPNYEVKAEYEFRTKGRIFSFMPHAHLRGKAFRFEAIYPDGRSETLLHVPKYNFNWQLLYELRDPLEVPAGTKLKVTAWYDNSENNPANPDPTVDVKYGEQTTDEMMIGYFNWHTL